MSSAKRDFSHVYKFTGYMKKITEWFASRPAGMKILDIPAGAGKMRDALGHYGHQVVCGDINQEKSDYVYADMNKSLPFSDNEFDSVICLEGIEHVIDPVQLIGEIVRVTRSGGFIIISTPNIVNMYSRLQFLFTGVFYQFNPAPNPAVQANEMKDRGHISPLTYYQLRYLFDFFGARIIHVDGDRNKRKLLFPTYVPIIFLGWLWARRLFARGSREYSERNKEMLRHSFSSHALFSRSIILYLQKK
jgi:SAM-dependent methyltransferase